MSSPNNIVKLFVQDVVRDAKTNLNKSSVTGKLKNSLKGSIVLGEMQIPTKITFNMLAYGRQIDAGRKGTKSSRGVRNESIFTATSAAQPPIAPLQQWSSRRGLTVKNGSTLRGTAFAVAKGIKRRGVKGNLFFTYPFKQHIKKLPANLAVGIGKQGANLILDSLRLIKDIG